MVVFTEGKGRHIEVMKDLLEKYLAEREHFRELEEVEMNLRKNPVRKPRFFKSQDEIDNWLQERRDWNKEVAEARERVNNQRVKANTAMRNLVKAAPVSKSYIKVGKWAVRVTDPSRYFVTIDKWEDVWDE